MKDQYAGDVNDFFKYGLLRALSGRGALGLGVCWMLTPPDGRGDGQRVGYLSRPELWRSCDPEAFDALARVVSSPGGRSVREVEASGILPGALFHSNILLDSTAERALYFASAREKLDRQALLFFDPDNGLEVASVPAGRKNSSKYLMRSELREAYSAGHSVLMYQHFPRFGRVGFVPRVASDVAAHTGAPRVLAFETGAVVFLLAAQPEHDERFEHVAARLSQAWRNKIQVSEHVAPPPASASAASLGGGQAPDAML